MKEPVSFRLKKDLALKLHEEAAKQGIKRNELVERLLTAYVEEGDRSERLLRKLDEVYTHYEPTMCDGNAHMRECGYGTYVERKDIHTLLLEPEVPSDTMRFYKSYEDEQSNLTS